MAETAEIKNKVQYLPTGKLKLHPDNPRFIRDADFDILCKSIENNPDYFEARPLLCTPDFVVFAGNMRLRAAKQLKLKQVPVVVMDIPEERVKELMIRDNIQNGEWEWETLTNEWDAERLAEFGLEMPDFTTDVPGQSGGSQKKETERRQWVPDCLFPSNNKYEIPTLLMEMQCDVVSSPVSLWGVEARTKKVGGGTILFYVDDYRFDAIWGNPATIADSGAAVIAEPNVSLYDTMPVSYGLHLIYKKRWIARYLQTLGVKVLVDLNVSAKFSDYNLLGVPDGWNAFSTRGYSDRIKYLENEIETAKKISGSNNPLIVVYGGGERVRDVVAKHNLIYIEQFRGFDKKDQ